MEPPGYRSLLRFGVITLAAIALLVGVVLLGGPKLVDLPAVKTEVERRLSQAVAGHIAFEALRVELLPWPHIQMRGVSIGIPGQIDARIEEARIGLGVRSLWRGQVEFTSIAVVRPVLRIDIPPSAPEPDQSPTDPDPVAAYRAVAESLTRAVRMTAPGGLFEISGADVLVRGTPAPELRLRGLSLRLRPDSTGFDVEVNADGNLWDRLNLVGRVAFADLSGSFGLEITHLDAKAWMDEWFLGGSLRMEVPRGDLRIRVIADAARELRCDIGVDAASLLISHGGHGMPVSASHLRGTVALHPRDIEVTLNELQIGSLIPAARGTLHMNNRGLEPRLEVDLPALRIAAVRDFVTALLAAESPSVRRHAPRALAGAIAHLNMRSEGENWNTLIRLERLQGSAAIEDASVLLPWVEQEARQVRGRMTLGDATFELAGTSMRVGPTELSDGSLRWSLRSGAIAASAGFGVDLPQALAIARSALTQEQRSALDDIESVAGRLHGRANFTSAGEHWNAGVEVAASNAAARLHSLPWPVALEAARIFASPGKIRVSGVQLTAGRSKFADVAATLELAPEPRVTSGSGAATLALDEIYSWVRSHPESNERLADIDAVSGSVRVTLNSLSGPIDRPSALTFDVTALPEQLSVGIKGWPAALSIAGGAIRIDADTVKVDRVGAALLDARAVVSGEIADYRGTDARIGASVADAVMGEHCVHWIWQRTGAPAHLEPRAPLRIAVKRATWDSPQAVEALGSVTFENGPEVTADLRWEPGALDIRRLVIRDRNSDATFRLHARADLIEASFSGTIDARSVGAMLKRSGEIQGQATGDLRVALDLEHRGRSSAQGALSAQALDLDEFLPEKMRAQARVDRLDLRADGSSLQIQEAAVRWAQQLATIHGRIAREGQGVFVDIVIDSPGIQIDALIRRDEPSEPQLGGTEANSPDSSRAAFLSWVNAMAVSGRVRLQSDFVEYGRLRLAPVTAALTLGGEQAELRLEDTQLCGLSVSMTAHIAPAGYTVSAQIAAQKQQVEQVARCLTDQRVVLTGEFDLQADLRTSGDLDQHLANLQGTIHMQARDGTVRKFALIGNILAMTDISRLLRDRLPDLNAEGFPYRTLDLNGHFSRGRFIVEDFVLDSSALGLGAEGSVDLATRTTQLDVLVAPWSGLTTLIRSLPILGPVLGGTLTSIPVSVKGDIRDPTVVPLAPGAVASSLIGLFTRALKIPEKLLTPTRSGPDSTAAPTGP